MEQVPLNANGKLSRKNLPRPDFTARRGAYVQPEGDREERLCVAMEKILRLEQVGALALWVSRREKELLRRERAAERRERALKEVERALLEMRRKVRAEKEAGQGKKDQAGPLTPSIVFKRGLGEVYSENTDFRPTAKKSFYFQLKYAAK